MKHRKHKLRFGDLERLEIRVVLSAVSPVADGLDALELLEFRRAAQFGRELRIGERVAEFRAAGVAEGAAIREHQSNRLIEHMPGKAALRPEAVGTTSVDFTVLAERISQARKTWTSNTFTPAIARENVSLANSRLNPQLELLRRTHGAESHRR